VRLGAAVAWRIPDDTINALRERLSIVEVVSNYVSLKKAGRNWLGLCPFHAEKTPSFTVNEERGLFHCFGCGAGGSVFTFLMQQERLEFREAVEMLAQRVGFALPTPEVDERATNERERFVRLNGWAAKRFSDALWGRDGEGARQYLQKRGVSEEVARRFGLGYAPAAGDFLSAALAQRPEAIVAAARLGLVSQRDSGGGTYDRFRARLMFPIEDARGAIVAFGGRALGEAQPKYLNSPESPLFRKSEVLYALPQARDEMRRLDEAIVVEGYLDALALIQFGIANVVATLGTALTPIHLKVLRRQAEKIVVFFDGDNAGRKAALRSFGVCGEASIWAHCAFLPDGDDPDSFVRSRGPEAVRALLAEAEPVSEFYFRNLQSAAAHGVHERVQAAREAAQDIEAVKDPIERDLLLRTAAARLSVGEDSLRNFVRRAPAATAETKATQPTTSLEPKAEVLLLESMALDGGIARAVAARGAVECFRNPQLAEAARKLVASWETGETIDRALEELPPPIAAHLREALLADEVEYDERVRQAEDCVRHVEAAAERPLHEAARKEVFEAAAANDLDRERESLRRMQEKLLAKKGR
jgi:DNA primase